MKTIARCKATAAILVALPASTLPAQVLHYEAMRASEVGALDRAHTAIIIPAGIIEEHGSYLPNASDGVRNQRVADSVASAIAARPGWKAVMLPMIPLGNGGFNIVAGRPEYPGTIGIRASTLRAVFNDIGDALGAQGFRWIFVVHGHGDPNHNRALDDAGDYFHATYGGVMVHLTGRAGCQAESIDGSGPPPSLLSEAAKRADRNSVHAGVEETARTWYLWPSRVDTVGLRTAPDISAGTPAEWRSAAAKKDWPGYVGAPRFATRALGEWITARETSGCSQLALRYLEGLDDAKVPRYADKMLAIPPLAAELRALSIKEDAQAIRQEKWRAKARRR